MGPFDQTGMASKVLKKTTPPGSPTAAPTPGQAAPTPAAQVSPLEDKEFMTGLVQMSRRIGADPLDLITVMKKESALNPSIVNSEGATGLIQFIPGTAADIGYSTEQIGKMTPTEQLVPIEKYLQKKKDQYGIDKFDLKTLYSTILTGAPKGKDNIPDSNKTTVNNAINKLTQDRARMTPIPESMGGSPAAPAPVAVPSAPAKEGGGFFDTIKGILTGGIPGMEKRPLSSGAPGIAGGSQISAAESAAPLPPDRPRASYDDTTQAEREELGNDPAQPVEPAPTPVAPTPVTPSRNIKTLQDVPKLAAPKPAPTPLAPVATPAPGTPGAPSGIATGELPIPPAPPGLGGSTPPIKDLQGVVDMGKPRGENDPNYKDLNLAAGPRDAWAQIKNPNEATTSGTARTTKDENPVYGQMADLVASMRKEREEAGKPKSLSDYYGEISATADKDRAGNLAKFMEDKDDHSKKQMWDTIIQALGGAAAGAMNLTMKGPGGYALDVAKNYKPTPVYDRKYEDELSAKEMEQRNIPIGERVKALLSAKEKDNEQQAKNLESLLKAMELRSSLAKTSQSTTKEEATKGFTSENRPVNAGALQDADNKAKKELEALGSKGSNLQGPMRTPQDADKANSEMQTRLGSARQVSGSATSADTLYQAVSKTTGGSLPVTQPAIQAMWKAAEKQIQEKTRRTQIPSQEIITKILDVLTNHFTTPQNPKELQMRKDTSDRYGIPMPSYSSSTYLNTASGKTTVITQGQ